MSLNPISWKFIVSNGTGSFLCLVATVIAAWHATRASSGTTHGSQEEKDGGLTLPFNRIASWMLFQILKLLSRMISVVSLITFDPLLLFSGSAFKINNLDNVICGIQYDKDIHSLYPFPYKYPTVLRCAKARKGEVVRHEQSVLPLQASTAAPKGQASKAGFPVVCFGCGLVGHIRRDCPKQTLRTNVSFK